MNTDTRAQIREALLESYKAIIVEKATCICCGKKHIPVFLHAISYYQDESNELPDCFLPMSASRGIIRGCFPICTQCAKPCSKCGLAMKTEKFEEIYIELKRKHGSAVVAGNGVDNHMHLSLFFHAIFKKIFKIGRFNKKWDYGSNLELLQ